MTKRIGIAVCAIQKSEGGFRFQVFPPDEFRAGDGRPKDVPAWRVSNPAAVLAKAKARRNDILIDYEHQSLSVAKNGQPAPAAGWFGGAGLAWKEGEGMFVESARLTERARGMVEADEYRYVSPVFTYDSKGNVLELLSVALTNNPALDGMAGVVAAVSKYFQTEEDDSVDEELLVALGLPEDAGKKDALAAIAALKKAKDDEAGRVAALRSELADAKDPAKFVPIAAFDKVCQENAALRKQQIEGVMKAAASKLPTPELREWAQLYGEQHGVTKLEERLAAMTAMPALDGKTQSGGQDPNGEGGEQASKEELAVLKALGLDDEEGRKAFAGVKGERQ